MEENYQIKNKGSYRVLRVNNRDYKTYYSKRIIKAIIARKGLQRSVQYFTHKKERSKFLHSLFNYLNKKKYKDLKVLECGCSTGHITEYLNEQSCIGEIYTYDIDRALVEITKMKKEELNLDKIKSIKHFSNEETLTLPYRDNFFDLIIVLAVVEHLPFENRYAHIDNFYKKLKIGGLIGFFDTPNRIFPLEMHSIGLPFIQHLTPEIAYLYAKLFRKLKGVSFPEFTRVGTGWRNSSYYELLPKTLMVDVKDISEETGYGGINALSPYINSFTLLNPKYIVYHVAYFGIKLLSRFFDVPISFFSPYLNVVFRKEKDYEKIKVKNSGILFKG